jgi:peptidoglycan-associated lipoprotein
MTAFSVGCSRNNPPPAPEPVNQAPPSQGPASTPSQPATDPNAALTAAQRDLAEMVFFDYDEAQLRNDARQTLDQKVAILRQYPAFRLMIEGHADERGSTEYNLALGTRRAVSIRDYLAGFGIDGQRFQTTSYGEERPMAQGQNEGAWSRNRRGEFRVNGGSGSDEQR